MLMRTRISEPSTHTDELATSARIRSATSHSDRSSLHVARIDELLATPASSQVPRPEASGDTPPDRPQGEITHVVSPGVVDRLEVVDIRDEEPERPTVAAQVFQPSV